MLDCWDAAGRLQPGCIHCWAEDAGGICGGLLSQPCAGRVGEGECSIKCSPASQLTSPCSFSLSMRQGNTAELIHKAFAELDISKALCHSVGLRKNKYHPLFRQRASGCQGICLRKLQMYVPNNQNLRVYYTTGYSNSEDDIAFNCPPPPPQFSATEYKEAKGNHWSNDDYWLKGILQSELRYVELSKQLHWCIWAPYFGLGALKIHQNPSGLG